MQDQNQKAKSLVDQQLKQAEETKSLEGKYEYQVVWSDGSKENFITNHTPQYDGNVTIVRLLDDKDVILINLNMRYMKNLRFPVADENSKIITPDGRDANSASIITRG